jgi:hypothetical protein
MNPELNVSCHLLRVKKCTKLIYFLNKVYLDQNIFLTPTEERKLKMFDEGADE